MRSGRTPGTGSGEWWKALELRGVFAAGSKPATILAYAAGPEAQAPRFAFLALDETASYADGARAVRRSVVALENGTAVTFDYVLAKEPGSKWATDAGGHPLGAPEGGEGSFLRVFGEREAVRVTGVDLEGARVGEWLVLFHAGASSAQSPVSFYVPGEERLRIVITGLSPGTWEIWHNGWVVEPQAVVKRREFALYFEGNCGDYFVRRLN